MENNEKQPSAAPKESRIWIGFFLLLAGLGLFLKKIGVPLPEWLFQWPMILILVGLAIGFRDRFQNPGSWIVLLIGFIFLANNSDYNIMGLDFQRFLWPLILVGVGLIIIFRPRRTDMRHGRCNYPSTPLQSTQESSAPSQEADDNSQASTDNEEYVNITSVFSGIKKYIFSKNFKGGRVISFMGGSEINLLQADIQFPVVLEINNVFGGTKLVVPPHWDIKNEVTAIFGGIEDKRSFQPNVRPDSNKSILIKGVCLFGGIEITNY